MLLPSHHSASSERNATLEAALAPHKRGRSATLRDPQLLWIAAGQYVLYSERQGGKCQASVYTYSDARDTCAGQEVGGWPRPLS